MNIDLNIVNSNYIYIESIEEDKEIKFINFHPNFMSSFSSSSTQFY